MAALHFGLALRQSNSVATAVLEAIGDRDDMPLAMVRGEAERLAAMETPTAASPEAPAAEAADPEAPAGPAFRELPPIRWD
jgi:hypothetical protein